ncbi:hypothetical protein TWF506_004672 [Arthrobotrys conoides]|uniref:C2H2-type domain-containing protein n=1 Tax=Arthrobotrys conoides TaxID=74498 RepID=A0AAN8RT88_9PEZI
MDLGKTRRSKRLAKNRVPKGAGDSDANIGGEDASCIPQTVVPNPQPKMASQASSSAATRDFELWDDAATLRTRGDIRATETNVSLPTPGHHIAETEKTSQNNGNGSTSTILRDMDVFEHELTPKDNQRYIEEILRPLYRAATPDTQAAGRRGGVESQLAKTPMREERESFLVSTPSQKNDTGPKGVQWISIPTLPEKFDISSPIVSRSAPKASSSDDRDNSDGRDNSDDDEMLYEPNDSGSEYVDDDHSLDDESSSNSGIGDDDGNPLEDSDDGNPLEDSDEEMKDTVPTKASAGSKRVKRSGKSHPGGPPFVCQFPGCKEISQSVFAATSHYTTYHTGCTQPASYQCLFPGCKKVYAAQKIKRAKDHVTRHQKICHFEWFEKTKHEERHRLSFDDPKPALKTPFSCDHVGCEKKYTSRTALYVHQCQWHSKGRKTLYICRFPGCEKTYENGYSTRARVYMERHQKKNHPEWFRETEKSERSHVRKEQPKPNASEGPPFSCDIDGCDRSYSTVYHLARHKTINHSSGETFCCSCLFPGCSKTISNPLRSLATHEMIRNHIKIRHYKWHQVTPKYEWYSVTHQKKDSSP